MVNLVWKKTLEGMEAESSREQFLDGAFDTYSIKHQPHIRYVDDGYSCSWFFGYNQMKDVRKEITKDILDSSKVDLQTARSNVRDISGIHAKVTVMHDEVSDFFVKAKDTTQKSLKAVNRLRARVDNLRQARTDKFWACQT